MRSRFFYKLALAAIAGALASAVALTAYRRYAAAVVGPYKKAELADLRGRIGALKQTMAEYRRAKTIPFPRHNPYTAEKALLGKKLYFDTRLSAVNLLSRATCQLAFLADESCDEVQGYLVGRPRPIEDYADLVGRPPAARQEVPLAG